MQASPGSSNRIVWTLGIVGGLAAAVAVVAPPDGRWAPVAVLLIVLIVALLMALDDILDRFGALASRLSRMARWIGALVGRVDAATLSVGIGVGLLVFFGSGHSVRGVYTVPDRVGMAVGAMLIALGLRGWKR